jgi:hypothetical protein
VVSLKKKNMTGKVTQMLKATNKKTPKARSFLQNLVWCSPEGGVELLLCGETRLNSWSLFDKIDDIAYYRRKNYTETKTRIYIDESQTDVLPTSGEISRNLWSIT